jgi:hypothetical protein
LDELVDAEDAEVDAGAGEDDPSLLTISCLASVERVPGPGLVRLIFILRPAGSVECVTVCIAAVAAIFPLATDALAVELAAGTVAPLQGEPLA